MKEFKRTINWHNGEHSNFKTADFSMPTGASAGKVLTCLNANGYATWADGASGSSIYPDRTVFISTLFTNVFPYFNNFDDAMTYSYGLWRNEYYTIVIYTGAYDINLRHRVTDTYLTIKAIGFVGLNDYDDFELYGATKLWLEGPIQWNRTNSLKNNIYCNLAGGGITMNGLFQTPCINGNMTESYLHINTDVCSNIYIERCQQMHIKANRIIEQIGRTYAVEITDSNGTPYNMVIEASYLQGLYLSATRLSVKNSTIIGVAGGSYSVSLSNAVLNMENVKIHNDNYGIQCSSTRLICSSTSIYGQTASIDNQGSTDYYIRDACRINTPPQGAIMGQLGSQSFIIDYTDNEMF